MQHVSTLTTLAVLWASHPIVTAQDAPGAPAAPQAQDADGAEAPSEPRGLLVREEGAFEGYTLISPLSSTEVLLLDMQGETVHTFETGYPGAGGYYLLDDGHLLYAGRDNDNPRFRGGGIGGVLRKYDWDSRLVWEYRIADDYQTHHHDLEPMPNGNVLVIIWEHRFAEDAVEFGRDPAAIGEDGMWPDAVLELRPLPPNDAEVVWEWHAWDHLVQDFDETKANFGAVTDAPGRIDINVDHRDEPPMSDEERERREEMLEQMRALGYVGEDDEDVGGTVGLGDHGDLPDWLHTNSVSYHPEHDLIVLSSPHLCEIFIIDHGLDSDAAAWSDGGRFGRGGDLLWRWGNPANYGAGTESDQRLFYQHHPTWVPDAPAGELRLLVFNNGGGRPGGDHSSVEELVLPFDAQRGFQREPGQPFGPTELAWSYADPGGFFSSFISGAQRLPNGNTLICSGAPGRVFEVTPDGRIVWDYRNPHAGKAEVGPGGGAPPHALFRATRLAPDHPGLAGRSL